MAMRRRGRPGSYLMTDDWTGCTIYKEQAKKDYWGNLSQIQLKRNLQEISQPLNDPYPVKEYRGPQYEQTDPCQFEVFPQFIGNTLVPFNTNNLLATAFNFNPSIPNMQIGCTFIVQPSSPFATGFLTTQDDTPITTMDGDFITV